MDRKTKRSRSGWRCSTVAEKQGEMEAAASYTLGAFGLPNSTLEAPSGAIIFGLDGRTLLSCELKYQYPPIISTPIAKQPTTTPAISPALSLPPPPSPPSLSPLEPDEDEEEDDEEEDEEETTGRVVGGVVG
mmetsp:Transcript_15953/g.25527  ORF Transcript_15953/g.25527 Transcript_15953/m.25527 type:complete len:132 (-) Transcript_15953:2950-3345(-)